MKISSSDKAILRKLAEQVAAIAALPSHKATIAGWKRLNGLGHCKPMIRINEVPWHEMDVDGKLTLLCSDALCRIQEEHSTAIFAEDRWQPERARRALREFLEQSRGCIVEIIMKDISTVRYQPRRLWQWAALRFGYRRGIPKLTQVQQEAHRMSYADGWAAIHLEMPPRVPRTEFSAWRYWDLIRVVTGVSAEPDSPPEVRQQASNAFMKAWNFDLRWATLISSDDLAECRTDMGHAEYDAGGADRRDAISCPFKTPEEALAFDPWGSYGPRDQAELTRRFEEHYRQRCAETPDCVNMTGIYITLVSGLIEIFGWEMLLLAAGTDPARFGRLTDRYAAWIQQYFEALAAADVPVVMIHDDMVWSSGPFISPAWYREHVFPSYRRLFAPLRDAGKKILYTCDGNYTRFIDDVAACGVHGFVLEPWTDMAYLAERYGRTHVFVGNADTRILLSGTKEQIRAEVARCMAIGKGCPGYFMAVGNHIPANTPIENALYYNQVYEELCWRAHP